MKFNDIFAIIKAHIMAGDTKTVFSVLGSPGCGKSALGAALGADPELKFDRVLDLNFSYLDVPDVAGMYYPGANNALEFKANPSLLALQTGRNLLIIDEATDASMLMQNIARRLFWTREINGVRLSDETFVVLLGNRLQDKSGAGKFSGKVKNAVTQFTMEADIGDWTRWAIDAGMPDHLINFLRFRPDLLDKYDPDADASPTPRQWELVGRIPRHLLPEHLFLVDVAGKVGEGPAAEYLAYLRIADSLIAFEDVVADPKSAPVPDELSGKFAMVAMLIKHVTEQTLPQVSQYVDRFPVDFINQFWIGVHSSKPKLLSTREGLRWAASANNLVLG